MTNTVKAYDFSLKSIFNIQEDLVSDVPDTVEVLDDFLQKTFNYKYKLGELCAKAKNMRKHSRINSLIVVTDTMDPNNPNDCRAYVISSADKFHRFDLDKCRYVYAIYYDDGVYREVNWVENLALKNVPYCSLNNAFQLASGHAVIINNTSYDSYYEIKLVDNLDGDEFHKNCCDLIILEHDEEIYRVHTSLNKSIVSRWFVSP